MILDATVAWPHVDLVFAPTRGAARLGLRVDGDHLVATLHASEPAAARYDLVATDERVVMEKGERIRRNRIERIAYSTSGSVIEAQTIADNRKRMLHHDELGRSCLSCNETECADRPAETPKLIALRGR